MDCKIIAEIGWNFMGDMALAEKMIVSAKVSGVFDKISPCLDAST